MMAQPINLQHLHYGIPSCRILLIYAIFYFCFAQGLSGSVGMKGEKGSAVDVIGARVSLCITT